MKITEQDQFKINHTYYFVITMNTGIYIYACKYADWNKERTKQYGYNTGNADMLKITDVILATEDEYDIETYMQTDWYSHRNFYTTEIEAKRDAVTKVFSF